MMDAADCQKSCCLFMRASLRQQDSLLCSIPVVSSSSCKRNDEQSVLALLLDFHITCDTLTAEGCL